ncbi:MULTISPECIES: hypothetical protein [Klebsiella]|uniref:hypothetical protein n=1 Tax=Klebsiella TaxID=570 RepID=UPI00058BBC22|nr:MULTISPECIES: hypothetical protein [Klebsiella]HBT5057954.1 hypothetical protein [Klebsiella pneumoniae]EIY5130418.1 hypothetical protein [Klebsiella variicola]ELY7235258.1 hypothetical protein [Klebsiella variicola]MBY5168947.1 hypothetical protein [Klebsiella variicola]GKM21839.1 hypothetical protein NUKP65_43520 [Klebsiella variicola]
MINLSQLFDHNKGFTDVVSYATDPFACVMNMQFDTLAADVHAGDVLGADGSLYTSGDDAYIVVADYVPAGSARCVNVLRSPAMGSWVQVKKGNLNAGDVDAAVVALVKQGFRFQEFQTS